MPSYQEVTRQIADKWIAAFKRAQEAFDGLTEKASEARGKFDIPQVELPEQLAKLNEALAQRPNASEIVQASFDLTERLLAAQKELMLKLLAGSEDEADAAPEESAEADAAPVKPATKADAVPTKPEVQTDPALAK